MDTLALVARPVDATGMHVSMLVSDLVFLSVLVCPVLVEEELVVLRLSDIHLTNLTLRVNGQEENVNTMNTASGRRLLVVLSEVAVRCLDSFVPRGGVHVDTFSVLCGLCVSSLSLHSFFRCGRADLQTLHAVRLYYLFYACLLCTPFCWACHAIVISYDSLVPPLHCIVHASIHPPLSGHRQ